MERGGTMIKKSEGKVNIRPMVMDDIDPILEIDKKIVGAKRAASYSYPDIEHLKGEVDFSFVAESNGEIVGFILGTHLHIGDPVSEVGLIQIVGIDTDYRRQGIAQRLVNALVNVARTRGLKTVRVMVRDDDTQLSDFFTHIGFGSGRLIDYSMSL